MAIYTHKIQLVKDMPSKDKARKIAVLDFGGQYVPNLERNFKESGYLVTVYPWNVTARQLENDSVSGVVLSGGPYSVYDENSPKLSPEIFQRVEGGHWPMLGICYGHQLIADHMKGKVAESFSGGEYGFTRIKLTRKNKLFDGIPSTEFTTWMSHRDKIEKMPVKFISSAKTVGNEGENAAIKHEKLEWYGLQFHPEVTHTEYGDLMLRNFATISNVTSQLWNVSDFINEAVENIRSDVKNSKVIAAVSGGVDSTVAAVLTKNAIGSDNLLCVHVDTGLMRKDESQSVLNQLQKIGLKVKIINAQDRFLKILKDKLDSDEKRRAIGEEFIRIFEEEATKFGARHLMQATIQPDVIESTRGQSKKLEGSSHGGHVKLHHNVGGLPDKMDLMLVEPLRALYKYQVWTLGKELGLPKELSERQPSPGPSAAVRIVDNITHDKVILWQEINDYVEKKIEPFSPTQYFSVLIPNQYEFNKDKVTKNKDVIRKTLGNSISISIQFFKHRTVGVKGDERVYGKTIAVSIQGHDKEFVLDNYDHIQLLNLQCGLTGADPETVRVAFLLSEKIDINKPYAVLIRAVESRDFMTAVPKSIPWNVLREIDRNIRMKHNQIGATYVDYTTKPSATIEYM